MKVMTHLKYHVKRVRDWNTLIDLGYWIDKHCSTNAIISVTQSSNFRLRLALLS